MDGMRQHATALADAIEVAVPAWVERCVESRLRPATGEDPDWALRARTQARAAGLQAQKDVGARVRELLESDIDDQATTPLAVLREAVSYPTEVLRQAGVPEVRRDEHQVRLLPDDAYDLAPASFSDVDPSLAEVGIAWGAAKAYEHIRRHGGGRRAEHEEGER